MVPACCSSARRGAARLCVVWPVGIPECANGQMFACKGGIKRIRPLRRARRARANRSVLSTGCKLSTLLFLAPL